MNIITIVASEELAELNLNSLIGRTGEITEVCYHKDGRTVRGAWVALHGEPYLNEHEWYIPVKSIVK